MILDFTISNFLSIKERQTLSFEATNDKHLDDYYVVKMDKYRILKMAVVMGANASGKSNVLMAFYMFPVLFLEPCETKSSSIEYDRHALDNKVENEDSKMIVNFICDDKKYRYEVRFNNNYVDYEILQAQPFGELRPHKVYERFLDKETMVSQIKWGDKYRSASNTRDLIINLLPNRTLFGSFQKSNVDIPWMKAILDWIGSYMLPIVKTSEQNLYLYTSKQIYNKKVDSEQVVRLLKNADVGVSDFSLEAETRPIPKEVVEAVMNDEEAPSDLKDKLRTNPVTNNFVVHMMHKGAQGDVAFEFEQESNGTKRFYELSSILLKLISESHFVAIDELENKLHPDLYQHFINIFLSNSKSSQLVFTTHMREFLNDRELFRDDAVWLAEKDGEGATQLYSLADFGSDVLRGNSNRYNAYRIGRLGAIPRLGDTYIKINEN